MVRDASTGLPVGGAAILLQGSTPRSQEDGSFHLDQVPKGSPVRVLAAGYEGAHFSVTGGSQEVLLRPFIVKGLYLSFYTLAWEERREHLLDLVDRSELNAVVMDMKGDWGLVNAGVSVPLAREIGAQVRLVEDMGALMARLKQKGIYTIARVVVFKDGPLAKGRPELAVRDSGTGDLYVDCEDQLWVDPFRREVWEYNIAIALQSARLGFDEIQFDYVRFPSDCIKGNLLYSQESDAESRQQAVQGFLAEAWRRLKPEGIFLAADTFGWTLFREEEMGIGQLIEGMAPYLDYLSPMVYPSTWGPGSRGLEYPAAYPYEIVFESLKRGKERLEGFPWVKIRPWLQDYHDYGPRRLRYGAREVLLQRRAAEEAGSWGFLLWNAGAQYTEEALAPGR